MKTLKEILDNVRVRKITGSTEREISGLTLDSRKVKENWLFAAIDGYTSDGHDFIEKALDNGAKAILCEKLPAKLREGITYIEVNDSAEALGWMTSGFYDKPSEKLNLVGITGTNGKTTVTTLLYDLFKNLGYKTGLISTIENRIHDTIRPATHTTPDSESINLLISEMVEAGCDYAFMEVSSHATVQKRIAGLRFRAGVFTNISHEHLDYHKTFKAYIEAKKMFFDILPEDAFAIVNADDRRASVMVQNTRAGVSTFALRKPADFKARILENNLTGLVLDLNGKELHTRLVGEFNAYNLLAAYAVAMLLDQDEPEVMRVLSNLRAAEGRFDLIQNSDACVTGIIDYAHTPDALEKVLSTIHQLRKGGGRIITVVGCGGDRDRTKRPLMAKVACDYSDQVIFTSDNPRSENPEDIIAEMQQGVPPYARNRTLTIANRREAIRTAAHLAKKGDVILVAGKGHEKYQEIMGVRYPFDDKQELRSAFSSQ